MRTEDKERSAKDTTSEKEEEMYNHTAKYFGVSPNTLKRYQDKKRSDKDVASEKEEEMFNRAKAAKYFGVSPNTLKRYPIKFVQYSKLGYALYKKSDLDDFKRKSIVQPVSDVGRDDSGSI